MPPFAELTKTIAFLRSEIPTRDISTKPVVEHPHNSSRKIPERLPPAIVKEFSTLEPGRVLTATAAEWASIAAAIALCTYFWHPALYVLAVMFIGARQHALIIMGHDASHYRYLPTRWQNELFANVFLMWPVFASLEGFRKFHSTHHQYTGPPRGREPAALVHARRRRRAGARLGVSEDAGGARAGAAAPRLFCHRPVLDRARVGRLILHPVAALDGRGQDRLLRDRRRRADRLRRLVCLFALLDRALLHLAHRHPVCAPDLRAQRRRQRRGRIRDHAHDHPDLARVGLHPAVQCRLPH